MYINILIEKILKSYLLRYFLKKCRLVLFKKTNHTSPDNSTCYKISLFMTFYYNYIFPHFIVNKQFQYAIPSVAYPYVN